MDNNVQIQSNYRDNDVMAFSFAGHSIRAVKAGVIDKHPWFLGKDMANALGFSHPNNALRDNVEDTDKKSLSRKGMERYSKPSVPAIWSRFDYAQKTIITKQGAFDLILNSRIPQAKKFKHWLTHDVLPQIDKTGNYISNDATALAHNVAEMGPNHIVLMLSKLARKSALDNIAKQKHITKLSREKQQMLPDYRYGHNIHNSVSGRDDNWITFANTLKTKGLFSGGSNKFGRWMREFHGGFIIKRRGRSHNLPKARYAKYFHVVVGTTATGHKYHQVLINMDGQVYFTNLLAKLKCTHNGYAEPLDF